MSAPTLYLYTTDDCTRYAEVVGDGGDIQFPADIGTWSQVLDCRVEPYTDKTLAQNCDLAHHVRKDYILVGQDQVSTEHPATQP